MLLNSTKYLTFQNLAFRSFTEDYIKLKYRKFHVIFAVKRAFRTDMDSFLEKWVASHMTRHQAD